MDAIRQKASLCHDLTIVIGKDDGHNADLPDSGILSSSSNSLKLQVAHVETLARLNGDFKTTKRPFGANNLYAIPPSSPQRLFWFEDLKQIWTSLFWHFKQLRSLTMQVNGDCGWPGRTEIEDTLVALRIALEQSPMPELKTFTLSPVHAMGIQHLCWSGFGVFGSSSGKVSVWQKLDTLDLRIVNPVTLDDEQLVMFRKVLYNYLASFSSTIRVLRLVWIGAEGPCPLRLDLEPGLYGRPPIQWRKLEELWIGNAVAPDSEDKKTLPPAVRSFRMLRSTHKQSTTVDPNDSSAWLDIAFRDNGPKPSNSISRASSFYSQGQEPDTPCSVSRSSRSIQVYFEDLRSK